MSNNKIKVLFFGRGDCKLSEAALDLLKNFDFNVTHVLSNRRGEVLPESVFQWSGDYIFCFRSLFILPRLLIQNAKVAAINFHPGPPEYPGSGCINFALYENASQFGVTAHMMDEKIDSGKILACRRFPIARDDNVSKLLKKTHFYLFDLFAEFIIEINKIGAPFIETCIKFSDHEHWSGSARKIQALNELSIIDKDITIEELERVIRAVYTKDYPPKVVLHGYEFILSTEVGNWIND